MNWFNEQMAVNGMNAYPEFLAAKHARIRDPHVAPLNDLADEIADARGMPRKYVPYVDPDSGGIYARVMVMLDNPSTKAEAGTGSGLLSIDNDDRTARNMREAYALHGVPLKYVVPWNAVPFPVAGLKNGGSTPAERREGAPWIREFVRRCMNLEYVLLLGAAARDGWKRTGLKKPEPIVPWPVPHPSMRGLNSSANARTRFESAIQLLAQKLN
ncbi:uracil-DNA glycosylase [Mycobacterium mantenii]|uniref:uracil-DNA glycosylase n=1 Tax=Mycobacterium mantenii TaxID=560555 RepID=UPI000AEE942B|nr:uracil-DNA glycosylase [Mycobacterium mantenii]